MKAKATPTAPDPVAAFVDELGVLERELAPLQTKIARVEMLRKAIRKSREDATPAAELQIEGARFVAILGPRGNQTVIDFAEVVKRIKAAAFAKFATCTLAALTSNVDTATLAAVTRQEQTGPRSLRVLEKGITAA